MYSVVCNVGYNKTWGVSQPCLVGLALYCFDRAKVAIHLASVTVVWKTPSGVGDARKLPLA